MRPKIVSGETASKLSGLFLRAVDDAEGNLIGEGVVSGVVSLNGEVFRVRMIVDAAKEEKDPRP